MPHGFTHAHAAGAMRCRATQQLAQSARRLMKGRGHSAACVNCQARKCVTHAHALQSELFHQQGRGVNDDW